MNATATFLTNHANRHMTALCAHFARKVPVLTEDDVSHVSFPFGQCDLSANAEHLKLTATARARDELERVVEVVSNHLDRFAFRENPNLTWTFADH